MPFERVFDEPNIKPAPTAFERVTENIPAPAAFERVTGNMISAPTSGQIANRISVKKQYLKEKSSKKNDPEQKEKQSLLFRVLDNVNRPQYAISNVIHDAVDGGNFEPLKSFVKGLSLKEKTSIGDSLSALGWNPKTKTGKVAKFIIGFAGDVLTDPLTYTGFGLITKSGKALRAGSTAVRTAKAAKFAGKAPNIKRALTIGGKIIPKSEKIIDPLTTGFGKVYKASQSKAFKEFPVFQQFVDKIGTSLSTKYRPRGIDSITWTKWTRAAEKSKNIKDALEFSTQQKAVSIAREFAKEGFNTDDIAKITNQIETVAPIASKAGRIAREFSEELSGLYEKVGVTGKKLLKEDGYGYLPHVLENPGQKLRKAIGLSSRQLSTSSPADIKRTLLKIDNHIISTKTGKIYKNGEFVDKFDLDTVENLIKQGNFSQATIKEINDNLPAAIFTTNLSKLLSIQGNRTAKVVASDELFKRAARIGTKKKVAIANGYEESVEDGMRVLTKGDKKLYKSTPSELKDIFFDKEITQHLNKTYEKFSNINQVDEFVNLFDTVQNAWKSTATKWNPAFHSRNGISNVWQNSLAGVNDVRDYVRASKIQRFIGSAHLLDEADQILLKEFNDQGLSKAGQMSGDIAKSVEDELMSSMDYLKASGKAAVKGKPLGAGASLVKGINKAGGVAGTTIENNAKLAHFIAKRKSGLSSFDAGQSVKKYLFDYSDLTDFERNVLKRVFPFYTWTRKNIPLQLETLITNPARQSKLVKLKNNVEVLTGPDTTGEILPEWLKTSVPVYVGTKDGKKRYVKLEGFLPTADLEKLSMSENNNLISELINMASPIGKVLIEQGKNTNFFFGSDIQRYKGQKKDLLWWQVPARLEHLARMFRPLSEIEKIVGGRRYGHTDLVERLASVGMGGKLYEYKVDDLLRKYDRLTDNDTQQIKSEIRYLRSQALKEPERRTQNYEDITMLRELLQKSKQESVSSKRAARAVIFTK